MTPLYDRQADLIGWFDGTNLFDLRLDWVGFHRDGHLFATTDAEWLGPLVKGSFLDRGGRVVGWLLGATPAGALSPQRPMRPMRPLPPKRPLFPPKPHRPGQPVTPFGGWSGVAWLEWLRRAPPPTPPVDATAGATVPDPDVAAAPPADPGPSPPTS